MLSNNGIVKSKDAMESAVTRNQISASSSPSLLELLSSATISPVGGQQLPCPSLMRHSQQGHYYSRREMIASIIDDALGIVNDIDTLPRDEEDDNDNNYAVFSGRYYAQQ